MRKQNTTHFYYTAGPDTGAGRELAAMRERIIACDTEADRFAAATGAVSFYPAMSAIAGGVSALIFGSGTAVDETRWSRIGTDADGMELWTPAAGSPEETRRLALPVVSVPELLALLSADLPVGRAARVESPLVFLWEGTAYVRSIYPCTRQDLTPVSAAEYRRADRSRRRAAGGKGASAR